MRTNKKYHEWVRHCKDILYPYKERIMVPVRLVLTLRTYRNILKIFESPSLKSIKDYHPRIRSKYARKNYLGLSLSYYERGQALAHHYRFLQDHVSRDFLDNLMTSPLVLWEERKNSDAFIISLAYPNYELEGDFSLIFWMNSFKVFTQSITIIPGHIVELPDTDVILISRSQGTHGSFDALRTATKILYDITPASLLIVVVMAIAASFKISGIAGITSQEQVIAGRLGGQEKFSSTYEKIWLSVGGKKMNEKVYRLPTVLQGRPLTEIRQKHRARTKRKREYKHQVFDYVLRTFTRKIAESKTASIEIGPQIITGGNVVPV